MQTGQGNMFSPVKFTVAPCSARFLPRFTDDKPIYNIDLQMGIDAPEDAKNIPDKYRAFTRILRIINAGRVELSTKSQSTKGSL